MKDLFGNEVPDPPFINERERSTKSLPKAHAPAPDYPVRPYTTFRDKDGLTWVINAQVKPAS